MRMCWAWLSHCQCIISRVLLVSSPICMQLYIVMHTLKIVTNLIIVTFPGYSRAIQPLCLPRIGARVPPDVLLAVKGAAHPGAGRVSLPRGNPACASKVWSNIRTAHAHAPVASLFLSCTLLISSLLFSFSYISTVMMFYFFIYHSDVPCTPLARMACMHM